MSQPSAVTRNAASEKQQRYGKRKEKSDAERRFNLVAAQMATYQGREFVWSVLQRCGILDHPEGPSDYVFQCLGQQRVGKEIYAELFDRHPEAFLVMQREAITRAGRADVENAAAQVASEQESE